MKNIIAKIKSTLDVKGIRYVDVLAFTSKSEQVGDHKLKSFIEMDSDKIRKQIEAWNRQVYESNFSRNFKLIFVRCKEFYEDEIDFYVVTDKGDSAERQRNAFYIGLEEGIRYRGGYYWHKPSDNNLFSLSFDNKPNMEEVRKRAEILLSRIKKLTPRGKKIEH